MKSYLFKLGDDFKQKPILGVLCAIVILFALFNLALGIRRSFSIDGDFWFQYVGGVIWNEKGDAYNVNAYTKRLVEIAGVDVALSRNGANRYPPQGLAFFGFLAHFTIQNAQYLMLGINIILLLVSTCLFGYILSWYRPIGLLETTFLITLAGSMYGRVNLGNSQFGIIVCTLLLASFILMRRKKKGSAVIGGILLALTSFKPTSLPFYMLYYLRRRAYTFLVACVIAGALLTFLPLILNQMPLVKTIQDWTNYVRTEQDTGDNNPSPFNSYSVGMTHLEPLVFRVLNDFSPTNRLISNVILVILGLYSAFLIVKTKNPDSSELIDFAMVSGFTLLAIYHRVHDIFLIFPGLMYVYLRVFESKNRFEKVALTIIIIGSLFTFTLPGDFMANLTNQNPALANSYLWRVIAPVQTWASLVVFGTILFYKRQTLAVQASKTEPALNMATT